jgi:hypothetical protein
VSGDGFEVGADHRSAAAQHAGYHLGTDAGDRAIERRSEVPGQRVPDPAETRGEVGNQLIRSEATEVIVYLFEQPSPLEDDFVGTRTTEEINGLAKAPTRRP